MGRRANGEGSIYKQKEGLWAASVTIGRDASTGKLVRKYVYGKTKPEAKEKRDALLEQARGGIIYMDADKITVGQWVEKYLAVYAKQRVRQNTYESYLDVANKHIIPHIGAIRLQKLHTSQIQAMINTIAAKHERTAGYAFTVLRMALRQALKEDLIFKDPTLAATPPARHKKEIRKLTPEEWDRLFEAARQAGIYLPVLLVWAAGLSREEVLGLRWSDIDFSAHTISVANVIMITKEGLKFAPPKAKSRYRQIPVPASIFPALTRHKAAQAAKRLAADQWANHDLLFCKDDGTPIDPRTFSHDFGAVAETAGINFTFHDLRHDHATQLFAGGWHPKDVQDRLGHANISMTLDTYTHHVPARQNGIADWLEKNLPASVKKPQP